MEFGDELQATIKLAVLLTKQCKCKKFPWKHCYRQRVISRRELSTSQSTGRCFADLFQTRDVRGPKLSGAKISQKEKGSFGCLAICFMRLEMMLERDALDELIF
jgi:hypothetical protein